MRFFVHATFMLLHGSLVLCIVLPDADPVTTLMVMPLVFFLSPPDRPLDTTVHTTVCTRYSMWTSTLVLDLGGVCFWTMLQVCSWCCFYCCILFMIGLNVLNFGDAAWG